MKNLLSYEEWNDRRLDAQDDFRRDKATLSDLKKEIAANQRQDALDLRNAVKAVIVAQKRLAAVRKVKHAAKQRAKKG